LKIVSGKELKYVRVQRVLWKEVTCAREDLSGKVNKDPHPSQGL
jgi:hypothetical protein